MKDLRIVETVESFDTKYKEGFTSSEVEEVINYYKLNHDFNEEKYYKAMYGNTWMVIDGETITYHGDLILGLNCALKNRNVKPHEWD